MRSLPSRQMRGGVIGLLRSGNVGAEIKNVITTYFQLRYEARKSLAPTNFSSITVSNSLDTAKWLMLEQERQGIERTIAETFDNK